MKTHTKLQLYTLIVLLTLAFLTSCDAPRRSRVNSQYQPYEYNNSSQSNSSTSTNSEGFVSPNTENTHLDEFQSCSLSSSKYYTVDIGFFNLCQSSKDETFFKVKTEVSSLNSRICLIPTYKDPSGASIYIGNPRCAYFTGGKELTDRLSKDRAGFSSYPLNGVIVLRESLLAEYFYCMNSYQNWPKSACPQGNVNYYCNQWLNNCSAGPQTNALCHQEATNFMNSTCSQFKSKYQSAYADIRTNSRVY